MLHEAPDGDAIAIDYPVGLAGPLPAALPEALPLAAGWTRWIAPAISAAIFAAVLFQLRTLDFATIWSLVPSSPAFWLLFSAYYFAPPLAEFVIFRRLWRIPPSGFLALVRKLIGNEILFGYIGEAYFYGWARRRSDVVGAPFGAIKDVTILSALVGNVVTLVMLVLAYPALGALHLGFEGGALWLSASTVLATSLLAMLFRRRLFSLPRGDLAFASAAHFLRIAATTLLAATMWHLVLPDVALGWWFLLATLRLLLSRLPFIPNKDLAFAGLAAFLVGRDLEIAALLTMMASLLLAAHLLLGAALTALEFSESAAERRA